MDEPGRSNRPAAMKPHPEPQEPAADPVWDLLSKSPPPQASPRFVADVLRAARLAAATERPWRRWLTMPRVLGGLAAAAAAVTMAILAWPGGRPAPEVAVNPPVSAANEAEPLAELQQLGEEELLLAAAEDLSRFSDAELLVLLGF